MPFSHFEGLLESDKHVRPNNERSREPISQLIEERDRPGRSYAIHVRRQDRPREGQAQAQKILIVFKSGVEMTPVEKIMLKLEQMAGTTDRDSDSFYEAKQELRSGECETGLSCPTSRHYESKSVAAQMVDGSWVGWTYWYGGGKHGEPSEMPWIEDAYDVKVTKVVRIVQEFSRASSENS